MARTYLKKVFGEKPPKTALEEWAADPMVQKAAHAPYSLTPDEWAQVAYRNARLCGRNAADALRQLALTAPEEHRAVFETYAKKLENPDDRAR